MVENSRAKLEKKKVDMICANNLKVAGAGFGVDTNVLTLITADGAGGTAPHVQGGGRRHHPGPGLAMAGC